MTIRLNRRQALLGATAISLTAAGCGPSRPAPPAPSGPFRHGVASGEPDATSVVLWTAITEDGGGERGVEVARDEDFTDIVFEQFETLTYIRMNPVTTVKILATGLEPGAAYFYRFRFNGEHSPVGRTRTLPDGDIGQFRVAVCSCSNYPAGYFNAYAELAARDEIDLVLHLGDYIYEYGMGGYGTEDAEDMDRVPVPAHECLTQADYAARHALYKSDPDLQAAHGAKPWFIMWDDHEVANDAWSGGAENHNPDNGEGAWSDRRAGALRAFHDWNPTREPEDMIGRARRIEIGSLATIALTESRHTARTEQLTFDSFPIPADSDDTPENRALVAQWLDAVVGDPSREMLGAAQIAEIADLFATSRADGKPWQILGGQVLLGRVTMPNYVEVLPGWLKWLIRRRDQLAWDYVLRSRFESPFSFDSWDGYPAERERLYAALREACGQFVAIAGDTHNFWACDLRNDAGDRLGFEFGTTSITSPSPFEAVPAPGVHFGRITEANNDEILHHEPYAKGFMVLTLSPETIETEFVEVSTIKRRGYTPATESRWRVTRGADGMEIAAV